MQGQHLPSPATILTDSTVPSARLLKDQLQQTITQVRDNLRKAQDRQKKYADTRYKDIIYTLGGMVLPSSKTLGFTRGIEEKALSQEVQLLACS